MTLLDMFKRGRTPAKPPEAPPLNSSDVALPPVDGMSPATPPSIDAPPIQPPGVVDAAQPDANMSIVPEQDTFEEESDDDVEEESFIDVSTQEIPKPSSPQEQAENSLGVPPPQISAEPSFDALPDLPETITQDPVAAEPVAQPVPVTPSSTISQESPAPVVAEPVVTQDPLPDSLTAEPVSPAPNNSSSFAQDNGLDELPEFEGAGNSPSPAGESADNANLINIVADDDSNYAADSSDEFHSRSVDDVKKCKNFYVDALFVEQDTYLDIISSIIDSKQELSNEEGVHKKLGALDAKLKKAIDAQNKSFEDLHNRLIVAEDVISTQKKT